MESEFTRPTIVTSAAHLAVAKKALSLATTRAARIAIAEKHKPHMLEADIAHMREYFKTCTKGA